MKFLFNKEDNTLTIDGCNDLILIKGQERAALEFSYADEDGNLWDAPCTLSICNFHFEGEYKMGIWKKIKRSLRVLKYIWK